MMQISIAICGSVGNAVRLALSTVLMIGTLTGCSGTRVPDVQIVERADWAGSDDTPVMERFVEHAPDRLTIHHAGVMDDGSVAGDEKMRRLFRFSVKQRPWGDVPYHFVIDRTGCIREGRDMKYAPDTNTSYDVNSHICICVNGDLTKQPLMESQYRSLVDLLVKLAADLGVPNDRIAGHKDYAPGETTCPGVLENYIEGGWLIEDMECVRAGRSYEFRESEYNTDKSDE
ncbi:MAG: hypothetical protein DHS20C16_26830 [Phycisphaerae bacterium]|nr:MAG: hypothetical protein DHS20C16_26830 [Phycisphaerae bacterium]